jgi:hypothetical protein
VFVDDHHPAGAEEPGAARGEKTHGPRAEDDHRVAALDLRHLRALVTGRIRVGAKRRVVVVDAVRDPGRSDVGVGHAHVFRLAAVVAAGGMRITEDSADGGRVGVRVVAVAE